MEYISLDFGGIPKTVAELPGEIKVPVFANGFVMKTYTRERCDMASYVTGVILSVDGAART